MSVKDKIRTCFQWIGRRGITVIVVLAAVVLGAVLHWALAPVGPAEPTPVGDGGKAEATVWTCSMHPEIRAKEKGRCPKCFMALTPLEVKVDDEGLREFSTSEAGKALMDIETAFVQRKQVFVEVRMVGKVDYDETRLADITAWVPGRLDRLYVDFTGITVRKGDHLVDIYSPELLSAQEELLQAIRTSRELAKSDVGIVRETTQATVNAAREKLRLWGLTQHQIRQLEQRGTTSDHITIYAPIGGVVIEKKAREGMYVKTGTRIYTLADLSVVWVKLDAYESDLMWVRPGQTVEFTSVSHPGKTFSGKVAFIDPVLSPQTRSVKVRVNTPNPEGKLKPGMFVRAVVKSPVTAAGMVHAPELVGKWLCPMHPWVITDSAGVCSICQMDLVTSESMGYGKPVDKPDLPLVIPASAVLMTGKRAVVYVEVPGKDKPTYEGHEVLLGPRAGDYYVVYSGLSEGQRVVTRGNFKIDSDLQIQAKPSMMSPEPVTQPSVQHNHAH